MKNKLLLFAVMAFASTVMFVISALVITPVAIALAASLIGPVAAYFAPRVFGLSMPDYVVACAVASCVFVFVKWVFNQCGLLIAAVVGGPKNAY